jgi:hypothetical protein
MRETALILHFIGIAMGVGGGFAFMFLGIAAGKLEPAKRREFLLNAMPLARMGQIGLGLLILTGSYLMTPYWSILADTPLLIAKLSLVLVLLTIVIINTSLANKAKLPGGEVHFRKIPVLGRIALLTSLAIVVLAVLVFR